MVRGWSHLSGPVEVVLEGGEDARALLVEVLVRHVPTERGGVRAAHGAFTDHAAGLGLHVGCSLGSGQIEREGLQSACSVVAGLCACIYPPTYPPTYLPWWVICCKMRSDVSVARVIVEKYTYLMCVCEGASV